MRERVGHGIFGWCSTERQTNRYGAIHLAGTPYEGSPRAEVMHDWDVLNRFDGKRVRITAHVLESRKSTHLGDRALRILPTQPEVGETVDLGVGIMAVERGYDNTPDVVLRPNDGRRVFWMDPHKLFHLHDQTVDLFVEETTDDFSAIPNIKASDEPQVFDNGDGSFQYKNVQQDDRILPRAEKLGGGAFRLTMQPGAGERLDVERRGHVYRADVDGEGFYYAPQDLEWVNEPTDSDPGLTRPTSDAVRRHKDGMPISQDTEDDESV